MSELSDFIASEKARMTKEREEYVKEQGFKPFVKWEQGITAFTLKPVIPRPHESFGTPKMVFSIDVHGEELDWSVNPRSPMYRDLIDLMDNGTLNLSINRLGEGLETRYNLAVISE